MKQKNHFISALSVFKESETQFLNENKQKQAGKKEGG